MSDNKRNKHNIQLVSPIDREEETAPTKFSEEQFMEPPTLRRLFTAFFQKNTHF